MKANGLKWYALYTRPCKEKRVAELLGEKGVEHYCPLKKVQRQWSDRRGYGNQVEMGRQKFQLVAKQHFQRYRHRSDPDHLFAAVPIAILLRIHWRSRSGGIRGISRTACFTTTISSPFVIMCRDR
ncbi:MAG: UpxY family transcription antiterminator [Bacteroidetes bacterium]|nr:UpxY family transcription antiterminator [Bacteroidota bacterium]